MNQDQAENQNWMFHLQNTEVVQGNPGFPSAYSGAQSLPQDVNVRETVSLDFFMGAHLWPGGEIYFNPEYYQGYGLGNSHGVADFPNGEAFKSGTSIGNVIIPHLFYRQTFGFGGEQEQLESDQLQLAQKVDVSRLTLNVGEMAFGDTFDDNAYSHDQRGQFMGWTFADSGAFDASSDSENTTYGLTLNLNQKNWALRYGYFLVTKAANGVAWDFDLTKAWQQVLQLDERYTICDHPGTVRFLGWAMSAHMGTYWDTVNSPSAGEDITQTAAYRISYGFAISADQEVTKDFGLFTRLSWRQPNDQEWNFTDMAESLAIGGQLTGTQWNRPNDVIGLGDTVGGLSTGQRTYFNNGGLGVTIGDGKLSYEPENVTELYYNAQLVDHLHLTGDVQQIDNPAYNSDRGPIFVFGARLHIDF